MHHLGWSRFAVLLYLASGGLSLGSPASRAVEPLRAYLDALADRQLFDQAADYLDWLEGGNLVAAETKATFDYERGLNLVLKAAATRDYAAKEKQLELARATLEKFIGTHAGHRLVGSASNNLANILVDRGRLKLALADKEPPERKPPLVAEAQQLFAEAQGRFSRAQQELADRLKQLRRPLAPDELDLKAQREQLAGDLGQVRWMDAQLEYELSKTAEPGNNERARLLKSAARKFADLHEEYRRQPAGLQAQLWEGRCRQELGQAKAALAAYRDLLAETSAAARPVQLAATRYMLECLTSPSEAQYDQAAEQGEKFLRDFGRSADANLAAIRYLTAVAYQSKADSLAERDPARGKLYSQARHHAELVALAPGDFQKPAKVLLAKASGKAKDEPSEPATFAEAYDLGQEAFDARQAAEMGIQLAAENDNADTVPELEQQRDEQGAVAHKYLKLALTLHDKTATAEKLNEVRYRLAYLAYQRGDYFDAALLGDFLARRYADSVSGREGARIALAAYVNLYNGTADANRDFEAAQIVRVAQYISQRWPEEDIAQVAAAQMVYFSIQERKLDRALEYLAKIPADSPARAQAELKAGQALWRSYQKGAQGPDKLPDDELARLKPAAQELLEAATGRLAEAEPGGPIVDAQLSLAQIYVDAGQHERAIARLEDARTGPLTLVEAGSPLVAREGFAAATYSLALLAYVGHQPPDLTKAEAIMDRLEKAVGTSGNTGAAEMVTAIYVSLGRQLQQQLQELKKSGRKQEAEHVSQGFEVFLARIGKRDTGAGYGTLSWVAETFYGLAHGLGEGGAGDAAPEELSPQVKKYFTEAAAGYQRILDAAAKDASFVPSPEALMGIRLRQSVCLRRVGKFDEATKVLSAILRDKPTNITAQVQAATALSEQGAADPRAYYKAIFGDLPGKDKQNLIWGWARLAKLTQNKSEFAETFYLARLKLADSRYRYGLRTKDEKARDKILNAAKQDVWLTYKMYPELGGAESRGLYEELLRSIQQSLGDKPSGFKEFKDREKQAVQAAQAAQAN